MEIIFIHNSLLPISDMTHLAREKARSDADFYKADKEAQSNKVS